MNSIDSPRQSSGKFNKLETTQITSIDHLTEAEKPKSTDRNEDRAMRFTNSKYFTL